MSAGFTPGPYRVSHSGFERTPHIVARIGGKPRTIARLILDEKSEANALVLAAAPDLYEALAVWVELIDGTLSSAIEAGYPNERHAANMEASKAALAKARGESA